MDSQLLVRSIGQRQGQWYVDGLLAEIERHDEVIATDGFIGETVEHVGADPLVTRPAA